MIMHQFFYVGAERLMEEIKNLNLNNFPSVFTYNQLIGAYKNTGTAILRCDSSAFFMNSSCSRKIAYAYYICLQAIYCCFRQIQMKEYTPYSFLVNIPMSLLRKFNFFVINLYGVCHSLKMSGEMEICDENGQQEICHYFAENCWDILENSEIKFGRNLVEPTIYNIRI